MLAINTRLALLSTFIAVVAFVSLANAQTLKQVTKFDIPGLKKFYTSNAYDNTIGVVDHRQMKVVKKLKTESKPDGSAYAAPFHKLYVSDERGRAEAIVDVRTDEILRTLHFDSETGMPQYDPVARKI